MIVFCDSQDNSVERAVDWIFSHTEELDTPMETDASSTQQPAASQFRDGSGSKLFRMLIVGPNLSSVYLCLFMIIQTFPS